MLVMFDAKADNNDVTIGLNDGGGFNEFLATVNQTQTRISKIYSVNNSVTSPNFNLFGNSDTNAYYLDNVQLFDLTACFGSEVADYLYGLENG